MRVRQREQVVEAVQWTGENLREVQEFMFPASPLFERNPDSGTPFQNIAFYAPKADRYVQRELVHIGVGQYIVKLGDKFIPVKQEDFTRLYETIGVPDGTQIVPETEASEKAGRSAAGDSEEAESAGADRSELARRKEANRKVPATH